MQIITDKINLAELQQMSQKMFDNLDDFIEFDSMINLRPWQNNRSRAVEDEEIIKKIINIISKLVKKTSNPL